MNLNLTSISVFVVVLMSIFWKFTNSASKVTNQIRRIIMTDTEHFTFNQSNKLPIFFFSHGGPTFADKHDKMGSNAGAWDTTKKIGTYIKKALKPDYIIVVSAHWQTKGPDEIEVSVPGMGEAFYTENGIKSNKIAPEENALVYDFYGFPKKFYDSQFHTYYNNAIAKDIVKTLKESDWFQAKTTERGIDHGAFVPLKVAFGDVDVPDSKEWDIDIPVIQVSLAGTSDIEIHYRLGEALSKYRSLNGAIIFSGMSVHNLRDLGLARSQNNKPLDYVSPFNSIISNILTKTEKSQLMEELKQLPRKSEYKDLYHKSHPTNEHLLPAIVGAGAAMGDECKELYSSASGSLGWNLYGWGNLKNFK